MNNKRFTWLILWVFFGLTTSMAQPARNHFSPEDFKKKQEHYITLKAQFTQEEAKAFFHLFHEMHTKQREVMDKIIKLKRQEMTEETKEDAYTDVINEITKLKTESARIEASYYKRLCKAISPRKVYKAMKAEDKFHREMLKGFNNRNRNKHPLHPQGQQSKGGNRK